MLSPPRLCPLYAVVFMQLYDISKNPPLLAGWSTNDTNDPSGIMRIHAAKICTPPHKVRIAAGCYLPAMVLHLSGRNFSAPEDKSAPEKEKAAHKFQTRKYRQRYDLTRSRRRSFLLMPSTSIFS